MNWATFLHCLSRVSKFWSKLGYKQTCRKKSSDEWSFFHIYFSSEQPTDDFEEIKENEVAEANEEAEKEDENQPENDEIMNESEVKDDVNDESDNKPLDESIDETETEKIEPETVETVANEIATEEEEKLLESEEATNGDAKPDER